MGDKESITMESQEYDHLKKYAVTKQVNKKTSSIQMQLILNSCFSLFIKHFAQCAPDFYFIHMNLLFVFNHLRE